MRAKKVERDESAENTDEAWPAQEIPKNSKSSKRTQLIWFAWTSKNKNSKTQGPKKQQSGKKDYICVTTERKQSCESGF